MTNTNDHQQSNTNENTQEITNNHSKEKMNNPMHDNSDTQLYTTNIVQEKKQKQPTNKNMWLIYCLDTFVTT